MASRVIGGFAVFLIAAALCAAAVLFGGVHVVYATFLYGVAVLLAVLAAISLCLESKRKWGSWVDLAPLLILGLVGFGYFRSTNEFHSRQEWLNILTCAAFYMGARLLLHRTWHLQTLTFVLIFLAVLLSGYAVYQHYSGKAFVLWKPQYPSYYGRASATFVCPNHYAGLMAMMIPMTLSLFLWADRSAPYRLFLLYAIIAMSSGLFLSFSRGGLIAMVVGVCVAMIIGSHRKTLAVSVCVILLGIGLGTGAFLLYTYHPTQWHRFSEATQHGDACRFLIWPAALEIFRDHPIFGVGPLLFDEWHSHYRGTLLNRATYVHNDYLQLLADYGLIGAVVMGFVLIQFWGSMISAASRFRCFTSVPSYLMNRMVGRRAFQRAFFVGIMGAMCAMLAHVVVDFDFHILANAMVFSVFAGLVVSLGVSHEQLEKQEPIPAVLRYVMATALLLFAVAQLPLMLRNRAGEEWRVRASEEEKKLEWKEADEDYQKAVEKDPKNSRAWSEYTLFLYKRVLLNVIQRAALTERFLSVCNTALQLNPLDQMLRIRRGEVLDLAGKFDDAEKDFMEAIQFDPNNPYYLHRVGLHFQKRGDPEKATEYFKRAFKLNHDIVSEKNLRELHPM